MKSKEIKASSNFHISEWRLIDPLEIRSQLLIRAAKSEHLESRMETLNLELETIQSLELNSGAQEHHTLSGATAMTQCHTNRLERRINWIKSKAVWRSVLVALRRGRMAVLGRIQTFGRLQRAVLKSTTRVIGELERRSKSSKSDLLRGSFDHCFLIKKKTFQFAFKDLPRIAVRRFIALLADKNRHE